jgi:prolyl oligopeptidase
MRASLIFAAVLGSLILQISCSSAEEKADLNPKAETEANGKSVNGLDYPDTKRGSQVDNYHGTDVSDPYRWLEDPDSEETKAWVQSENKVTFGYLETIPFREKLKDRLTELWNYARYSPPFKEGDQIFYFKNDGLQNQSVLYTTPAFSAPPRILLDPNTLSEDGTVALGETAFSKSGQLLAYSLAAGGSDWRTWRVRNVATGKDYEDEIKWSKFSRASWSPDEKGFYYSRYPAPTEGDALEEANYFHKVYYHQLGTPQSDDILVFEDKDNKERGFDAFVTDDDAYLVIHVWQGTDRRNRLYYKSLKDPNSEVVRLQDDFDAMYEFIGNEGTTFFVKSDLDAPKGKIIAIDTTNPARKNWKTVVAEGEDKLESATILNNRFLIRWLHNAHDQVTIYELDGTEVQTIALPAIGSVSGFSGKKTDTETFYSFESFTTPDTIYHLDLKTGESRVLEKPNLKFDPESYETRQVWVTSKDGTKVPMFLVHKKGLEPTGDHPTYLYAYGGFNISLRPRFSVGLLGWLERGGVYAMPNLRGGGEFGEEWHQAGMLDKKQNVFDDFTAAANWLIDNKITKKEKLAIGGGSNGGLLVGATITQNPDLVAAAICRVGVLDMLRYHRFTIGHAWVNEYGSADVAEQFPFLYAYSPLHNTKMGTKYPATMITTADHDDRVVPAHSFKFAAALQHAHGGPAPVLIRIETKAGHGAGKPTTKIIEEVTDTWAFLFQVMGESE